MNTNTTERNEYISLRVTADEKRRIDDAKDNYAIQMEIIKEIFANEKSFLKSEMAMMDDELLKYRAFLLNVRQSYSEAQAEHLSKLEEMWSDISKGLPSFQKKVKEISDQLLPLTNDIKVIKKDMDDMNTYRIKDLSELVVKVQNMGTEGIEMFKYLVEKFRQPKQ